MTVYDSSVLVEYLDGTDAAVNYVERHFDEHAISPALVMYEVYQGEIFKSGPADFDAIEGALEWVTVVDEVRDVPRAAAELQNTLVTDGTPFAARDAFIAGVAKSFDESLAVADSDFDAEGITRHVDIDFV